MCSFVVLQVSSCCKSLPAVFLIADKGFLSIVCPHMDLQSLQHIETLTTAFGTTRERPVVPVSETTKP